MSKVRKIGRPAGSTVLFAAAGLFALTAVASVVNNLVSFWSAVDQYVAQGYAAQEVISGLLPSQLLPSLFQSIVVYGGVAAVVFGLGQISQRLSLVLAHAAASEVPAPSAGGEEQEQDAELEILANAESQDAVGPESIQPAAPDGR